MCVGSFLKLSWPFMDTVSQECKALGQGDNLEDKPEFPHGRHSTIKTHGRQVGERWRVESEILCPVSGRQVERHSGDTRRKTSRETPNPLSKNETNGREGDEPTEEHKSGDNPKCSLAKIKPFRESKNPNSKKNIQPNN